MTRKSSFVLFFLLSLSFSVSALVDYTEEETPVVASPVPQAHTVKAQSRGGYSGRTAGGGAGRGLIQTFSLGSGVESLKADYQGAYRKLNRYAINTQIQTNYNFFLSADYWYASSDSSYLVQTTKLQEGNPTLKLGFNWLRFGAPEEMATIDFYAGGMLKTTSSDFASTRNDKIAGIETTKRFMSFAVALGWEIRMPGNPDNSNETPVGTINRLSAALGWRVSPDINLSVEGASYKVAGNKNEDQSDLMSKGFSFSYLSPKMYLKFSQIIGVELGAVFRADKVTVSEQMMAARLWMLTGLYGNSIYAGLNVSI